MIQHTRTRLLIGDDEPQLVEIFAKFLAPRGYDIATAGDGDEALAKASAFKPDCILLNYMMPRMDGLEAGREILKALPNCKLIFTTGSSDPKFLELYKGNGYEERFLLRKPFSLEALLAALMQAGFPPA